MTQPNTTVNQGIQELSNVITDSTSPSAWLTQVLRGYAGVVGSIAFHPTLCNHDQDQISNGRDAADNVNTVAHDDNDVEKRG